MTRKNFFDGLVASAAFGCRWFAFAAPLMRKQKRHDDTTWWDPYVENITDADTYIRRKFRQDVTDKTSGVGAESLKEILAGIIAAGKSSGESWRITKAKLFAAQAEKMSIDVSPETLRDAQKHPEKYENLQVRVAGWNIRWNDIPRKEQDEYIARIEAVGSGL